MLSDDRDAIAARKLKSGAPPQARAAPASGDAGPLVDLLHGIAGGEQRALARLHELTIGRVYGLALRIVRKPEAAEEIAGDVYLQVWKSASSFTEERGHPLAWLMVITRSRALDHLRRADDAESHPDPESLAHYALDENDPHNLLAATQSNAALRAALADLSPMQRQLLALAFFRGMSHSDIAGHMRMPLGTVKTHVRRALAALHAALA